jgi:lipid-A-disaccharide synthase
MNWASLLEAARRIRHEVPTAHFLVAAYSDSHASLVRQSLPPGERSFTVLHAETPEAIAACDLSLAVSGSVSLELLNALKPSMILYRITRLQYILKSIFMKVRYMSLVNLLGNDEIYPEYLSIGCPGSEMAERALRWIRTPRELEPMRDRLRALRDRLAVPGACAKAAQFILETSRKLPVSSVAISSGSRS